MKQDIILLKKKNKMNYESKKHKKVCTTLNCIEHLLILASAITGCVSIFLLLL